MELKFRKNDGREFSANLLLEKIGGGITTVFACEKGWENVLSTYV